MANELQAFATSGKTVYAVLLNSTGQVWNGSAFVAFNSANWTSYDIAMTEAGAGIYLATMPSAAPNGMYNYVAYDQAGGTPATSDAQLTTGDIDWTAGAVTVSTGTAYASRADLKAYLGISTTTDDDLLDACLDRATVAIEAYTGRDFLVGADSTRYFNPCTDVDGRTLRLGDNDLCQITTVTNGDGATISSSYYVTEPANGTPYYALTLKASSGLAWTYTNDPENAISILGRWGYSTTPPADVVQACILWAAQMYKAKDSSTIEAAFAEQGLVTVQPGMPKNVMVLLRHYRRVL